MLSNTRTLRSWYTPWLQQYQHLPRKSQSLRKETAKDETLQQLQQQMIQGWPDHEHEIPHHLGIYWNIRHEPSEAEGLIFKGHLLVIPTAMRSSMLTLIHESHLGIEKSKARAREILFWPGMWKGIYEKVSKCSTCVTFRRMNQKEPMIAHEIPERPWQKLGTDLCEVKGVVDYYSKYIETALLPNKDSGNSNYTFKNNVRETWHSRRADIWQHAFQQQRIPRIRQRMGIQTNNVKPNLPENCTNQKTDPQESRRSIHRSDGIPQHASYRNDILTIATADEPYHKNKDPSFQRVIIATNSKQRTTAT